MAAKRDVETILRIARLRFEAQRSQREIAALLQVSEATVSRALRDAFDLDLVEIRLKAPSPRVAPLERALIERFGLQEAVVVETRPVPAETLAMLGRAMGEALLPELRDGLTIGVGDGVSVAAVAAGLPHAPRHGVQVVPLIGGVGELELALHPSAIAREVAVRLNARIRPLPAPAVMPDAAAARQLAQVPAVADAFAAMRRCGLALVGVGPIEAGTALVRHHALSLRELRAIERRGAAGMICARAYDAQGQRVQSSLDARTIAIAFDDFKAIDRRWVVGADPVKAAALRAAFAGGIVTCCGTDRDTAARLLDGGA